MKRVPVLALAFTTLANLYVGCSAEFRLRGDVAFRRSDEHHSLQRDEDASAASKPGEKSAQDQIKESAANTVDKARKMNPVKMFWHDIDLIKEHLMPGKRPDLQKKTLEFAFVLCSVVWFIIYTIFIYKPDRDETLNRWKDVERIKRVEDPRISLMSPDLVLVFHHPNHECGDNTSLVSKQSLSTALALSGKSGKDEDATEQGPKLNRARKLLDKCDHDLGEKLREKLEKAEARKGEGSLQEKPEADGPPDSEKTTLHDVRVALLQDLDELLPSHGFDVEVFSSVDGDELIVNIALHDEATIKRLLTGQGAVLQIKKEVASTLGIDQDPDEEESSPPWIPYSTAMATNIKGEGTKDVDFWESFGHHRKDMPGGTILSGQQRIRIIYHYLNRFLNLDYAVAKGMLVEWFPAHCPHKVAELEASWARWAFLKDLSFAQPLTYLNDYFGSRVTFIFAWNGLYCKMLLALLPMALLFECTNAVAVHAGRTSLWNRGSVLGFALVVVVWARLGRNLWNREESYLISLWDLDNKATEHARRPAFHGEWRKSEIDRNSMELYYPKWKHNVRMTLSWAVTSSFTVFVAMAMFMWMDVWDGRLTLGATIVQAIMVQVFTQIYNVMAEQLTLAENHQFQTDYYNSYLKKLFVFQFVNQYCAFFYIGVKQQATELGCVDDDCVGMIKTQLPTTLAVLALMRVVQVVLATLKVKFALWWESRGIVNEGGEPPIYSYIEEQSKYGEYRIREQIEVMTQLCLTLGYVLIFGAVAPRIVPLCFLVFACQLRAGAVLVCTAAYRTVPRMAVGIGPWVNVIQCLLTAGCIFTGYLLVQFGPLFHGTLMLTKLTGLLLYGLCVLVLWEFIDLVFPPECPAKKILEGRRNYVKQKLMQKSEDVVFDKIAKSDASGPAQLFGFSGFSGLSADVKKARVASDKAIQTGQWASIPKALKAD
jgi:hypothetical protein